MGKATPTEQEEGELVDVTTLTKEDFEDEPETDPDDQPETDGDEPEEEPEEDEGENDEDSGGKPEPEPAVELTPEQQFEKMLDELDDNEPLKQLEQQPAQPKPTVQQMHAPPAQQPQAQQPPPAPALEDWQRAHPYVQTMQRNLRTQNELRELAQQYEQVRQKYERERDESDKDQANLLLAEYRVLQRMDAREKQDMQLHRDSYQSEAQKREKERLLKSEAPNLMRSFAQQIDANVKMAVETYPELNRPDMKMALRDIYMRYPDAQERNAMFGQDTVRRVALYAKEQGFYTGKQKPAAKKPAPGIGDAQGDGGSGGTEASVKTGGKVTIDGKAESVPKGMKPKHYVEMRTKYGHGPEKVRALLKAGGYDPDDWED